GRGGRFGREGGTSTRTPGPRSRSPSERRRPAEGARASLTGATLTELTAARAPTGPYPKELLGMTDEEVPPHVCGGLTTTARFAVAFSTPLVPSTSPRSFGLARPKSATTPPTRRPALA